MFCAPPWRHTCCSRVARTATGNSRRTPSPGQTTRSCPGIKQKPEPCFSCFQTANVEEAIWASLKLRHHLFDLFNPWHSGNGQPKIMAPNFAFINCRKSLTCSYNFSKMNSKVSYHTPTSEYNPHFEHLQATESEQAGQLRRASSVLSNPIHCVAVRAVDRHSLHQVSADYSVSVLRTVTVL